MGCKRRTWLVRNHVGIPVLLDLSTKRHKQGYKHEVWGSCNRWERGDSCVCESFPSEACKCNWVECFSVTGRPEEPLKDVLTSVADECGKLSRCSRCTAIVFDEPEFGGTCGSCFMQTIVDDKLKRRACDSDCPICLERCFASDSIKLPCSHYIHVLCSRPMLQHCPFCRAPCAEDVLLDHIPPRL